MRFGLTRGKVRAMQANGAPLASINTPANRRAGLLCADSGLTLPWPDRTASHEVKDQPRFHYVTDPRPITDGGGPKRYQPGLSQSYFSVKHLEGRSPGDVRSFCHLSDTEPDRIASGPRRATKQRRLSAARNARCRQSRSGAPKALRNGFNEYQIFLAAHRTPFQIGIAGMATMLAMSGCSEQPAKGPLTEQQIHANDSGDARGTAGYHPYQCDNNRTFLVDFTDKGLSIELRPDENAVPIVLAASAPGLQYVGDTMSATISGSKIKIEEGDKPPVSCRKVSSF